MNASLTLDSFIDRLSLDVLFREKVLSHPQAALAEYGLTIDASRIPAERTLPSMSSLQRNLEAYKQLAGDALLRIFFYR